MNNEYDHDAEDYGEEIEIEAIGIEVNTQPIELYKVMKLANLVSGGGEAKHAISEGYVAVNGELETRKRRKMYDGDFFEFNQEYYVVVFEPQSELLQQEPDNDHVAGAELDAITELESAAPAKPQVHSQQPSSQPESPKEKPAAEKQNKKPGGQRRSLDFL
ncbi:ribosome-associated protein [Vibrio xiamenensis]|uniref:Ribosome-associated protein n=1 Tax=Vibrio xiamenensis TaxID=861298 RepID=A0A1G8ATK7_9VIBR|nr:RNA-binding S4 domain-containing protein [Vibrio xiamenensis]SDH24279.1 ribosome-associated protein [Vibrio xiamenensis]